MKKFLRYFFELRFLPNLSSFLFDNETWLRLRPIKKFLKVVDVDKKKKIVDIGGGTGRLEQRLGRLDIHLYDINEEAINIARQNFDNVIVGSGTQIKCEDNFFDWAISMHTLEHIEKDQREKFIHEMIRISKEGIFLSFPEGQYAERVCKNFLNKQKKNSQELNKWTLEHLELGLPTTNEINLILEKQNKFHFDYKHIKNYASENLYWTKLRISRNPVLNNIISPLFALYRYLTINIKPSVELILIGTKNEDTTKKIIKKL